MLEYILAGNDIGINADPPRWPFVGVGVVVNVGPVVQGCLSWQEGVPRILHGHAVVSAHAVNVSRKGGEPRSGKGPGAARHNRINHSHVVCVEIAQRCKVPIIIEEPHVVMTGNVVEKGLVAFVRGNVQNFLGFPYFLGVVEPNLGRKLDFFVLKVSPSNVHGRIAAGSLVVYRKAPFLPLGLEGLDNLAGRTINAVVIVQEITDKAFHVIVHDRVGKVQHAVKVRQQPVVFVVGVKMNQHGLLKVLGNVRNVAFLQKESREIW